MSSSTSYSSVKRVPSLSISGSIFCTVFFLKIKLNSFQNLRACTEFSLEVFCRRKSWHSFHSFHSFQISTNSREYILSGQGPRGCKHANYNDLFIEHWGHRCSPGSFITHTHISQTNLFITTVVFSRLLWIPVLCTAHMNDISWTGGSLPTAPTVIIRCSPNLITHLSIWNQVNTVYTT